MSPIIKKSLKSGFDCTWKLKRKRTKLRTFELLCKANLRLSKLNFDWFDAVSNKELGLQKMPEGEKVISLKICMKFFAFVVGKKINDFAKSKVCSNTIFSVMVIFWFTKGRNGLYKCHQNRALDVKGDIKTTFFACMYRFAELSKVLLWP